MIGIFGGTFDPVHAGHLRTALEVREYLDMAYIRMIPCLQPPHRPAPVASPGQRLAMLQSALIDEPGLRIDTRELERPGPSYTVDTLESLREEFPDQPLGLILGMDAFTGLTRWHRWQDLPKLGHLIVVHRPGFAIRTPQALRELIGLRLCEQKHRLNADLTGCLYFLETNQLDISSTKIREMIRSNRSPRFLLPEAVLALIREQRLYLN